MLVLGHVHGALEIDGSRPQLVFKFRMGTGLRSHPTILFLTDRAKWRYISYSSTRPA